jgi:hypothetical protein
MALAAVAALSACDSPSISTDREAKADAHGVTPRSVTSALKFASDNVALGATSDTITGLAPGWYRPVIQASISSTQTPEYTAWCAANPNSCPAGPSYDGATFSPAGIDGRLKTTLRVVSDLYWASWPVNTSGIPGEALIKVPANGKVLVERTALGGSISFSNGTTIPRYSLSGAPRIHLDPAPEPLRLFVASPYVLVGDSIAVNADLDMPLRNVDWYFIRNDTLPQAVNPTYLSSVTNNAIRIAACAKLTTCRYAPPTSGRFYASGSPNGVYEARNHSAVVRRVTALPSLTCPDSVTRGQTVTCTVSNLGGGSVQSWEWVGETFAMDPGLIVSESSSTLVWQGIAVDGGTVTAHVVMGGTSQTLTDQFAVRDRPWRWGPGDWHYNQGAAPACSTARPAPAPDTLHIGWNRNAGVSIAHCFDPAYHRWILPDPLQNPTDGYTLAPVPSGPNKGLWYVVSAQYRIDRVSNLNPHLLPSGPPYPLGGAQSVECATAGIATPVVVNLYEFNKTCKGLDMDRLIAGAWGHEGRGAFGGKGHQGLAEAAAALPEGDPLYLIERRTGLSESLLRVQVIAGVDQASSTIDEAAGEAFVTGNWPGGPLWTWDAGSSAYTLRPIPAF